MTDVPTPSSSPPSGPTGPGPLCNLLVMCAECGDGIEVPLPADQRSFSFRLAESGWFVSVLTPPGQGPEVPILLGALCTACAQKVYPPEVFKAGEEARQRLLAAGPGAHGAAR